MKSLPCFSALVGLLAAALPLQAKIERAVEKTFTVQPGGTLHVGTLGGSIRVESSSDSSVKIVAKEHIRANSEAEADAILQKLTLTMEQQGNDVTANAEYEKETMGFHFGNWPPVEVEFVVTVPARFSAELRTSGGGIAVGDLAGTLHARTSGGSLKIGKISGAVDGSTSGGSVTLAEGGASVHLRTSGGSIRVGRAVGETSVRTSGGSIRIETIENKLDADTNGGQITARFVGPLKGDCLLNTLGGGVKVTVDAGVGFKLDAATNGGEVEAEGVTLTISRGGWHKSSLAGEVSGGGPLLRLRSSGGNIEVRTDGVAAR